MKKITLLIFLVFIVCVASAQGNLQFNRVVYHKLDTTIIASGSPVYFNVQETILLNVPVNKIWKIESINTAGTNSLSLLKFYLDKTEVTPSTIYPIWLPSGIYEFSLIGNAGISSGTLSPHAILSAIEFNIIP